MTEQYQQNNVNVPRGSRLLTEDTALNLDDDLVVASTAADPITLTLPRAQQIPGQEIKFKADDAGSTGNPVTIAALPGEDIDGAPSVDLTADQESICLKSDGQNWRQVCGGAGGGATCCAPQLITPASLGPGPDGIVIPFQTPSFTISIAGCNLASVTIALVKANPLLPPGTPPSINGFVVTPGTPVIADVIAIDFDSSVADGDFILQIENECGCCTVMPGTVLAA